ncbi:MAG TPA: hypothetical protein VLF18_08745 [Tahibacter sp.]|uniref:hypothetical protein n=1 Tax=Tahibacter sp. TaxID=2056211 RepID=UPI002CFCBDA2|nr:hypothetical protein [Tahibacter sp.]HSX60272.1 hypothetical protein [Tahibacter sp.]
MKSRVAGFAFALFFATQASQAVAADHSNDRWFWSTPAPQGNTLQAAASHGTTDVVVGDRGTIVTRHDGGEWVWRRQSTRAYLRDVAFGSGRFVAVGWGGAVVTSVDGFAWSAQQLDESLRLSEIASDGQRFVATVDDGATVVTSEDGLAWTTRDISALPVRLNEVIWAGDRFIALGRDGATFSALIFDSADGTTWVPHTVGANMSADALAFNGSTLLVVGRDSAANAVFGYTSTDRVQWQATPIPIDDPHHVLGVAGSFVSVGYRGGAVPSMIFRSANGTDWTGAETAHQGEINGAAWNGTDYIAVGEDGLIATSRQGADWHLQQQAEQTNLYTVRWLGDEFLALGYLGDSMRSSNGIDWEPIDIDDSATTFWGGVARGNTAVGERTVVVGYRGAVRVSADREHWNGSQMTPVPGDIYMNGVAFGDGKFVAVGDVGAVYTSPDGETWTWRPAPTFTALRSVVYSGSMFVAVGYDIFGGVIMSSPDGITWTVRYATDNPQFFGPRDVVWTGDYFVAAVASVAMVSSDGILWNTVQYDVPWPAILKLAWDGERILGVGFGVYSAKSDGGKWTRMPDPPQHYLESIASDGRQFIAVYSNGVVRTGDDLFADDLE